MPLLKRIDWPKYTQSNCDETKAAELNCWARLSQGAKEARLMYAVTIDSEGNGSPRYTYRRRAPTIKTIFTRWALSLKMRYAKGLGKSPTPKTLQGRIAGKLRPGALLIHLVKVAGFLWERDSLGVWRRQLNQNPHPSAS
jgi:hypothetical protein